jgi:hypothetical protein
MWAANDDIGVFSTCARNPSPEFTKGQYLTIPQALSEVIRNAPALSGRVVDLIALSVAISVVL